MRLVMATMMRVAMVMRMPVPTAMAVMLVLVVMAPLMVMAMMVAAMRRGAGGKRHVHGEGAQNERHSGEQFCHGCLPFRTSAHPGLGLLTLYA